MSADVVTMDMVLRLVGRHWWRCLLPALLGGLAALAVTTHMPKRFKSSAVVNVQSSYFRNPLVSDLVPEVTDASELNAQRQSLFRLALDTDFVDALGEDFGYFVSTRRSRERPEERAELLKKIEYISLNATTFQVSAPGETPNAAAGMLERVLSQAKRTFVAERYAALMRAREAIGSQVDFLGRALRELGAAGGRYQPEFLESELERIDERLALLRERYTENHPEIFRLKSQEQAAHGALERARRRQATRGDDLGAFAAPSSKAPVQDIYNDLLKKLSHLTIVLSMERDAGGVAYFAVIEKPSVPLSPVSPKVTLFLVAGIFFGVVCGLLRAIYFEYARRGELRPLDSAAVLEVPLFGELPALVEPPERVLGIGPRDSRAALPET